MTKGVEVIILGKASHRQVLAGRHTAILKLYCNCILAECCKRSYRIPLYFIQKIKGLQMYLLPIFVL